MSPRIQFLDELGVSRVLRIRKIIWKELIKIKKENE
jgi:hypothetical protein